MSDVVIQVESLWKKYRLGVLGTGTLRHDLNRWWHRVRGKPDPYAKVGETARPRDNKATRPQDNKTTGQESSGPMVSSPVVASSSGPSSSLRDDEMWALRDISFEVKQGEILGIIGRNGAGKSTLLKILSRVTAPTAGEIRVKGRVASLLEVGTGFHPELTGRENIFLNGAILGMTKSEVRRKLDEIVAFAEIEKFLDTPVKRYSSGMYVRLAFAVAAHLEPEILVVDEVLAVGDAEFQKKCLGKMGDVAKTGRTILFVSHNLSAVSALCSRVTVLNRGDVLFSGDVFEAINRYSRLSVSPAQALVDFSNRTVERFGEQQYAVWKTLQILDAEGNATTVLQMGQEATFELSLDIKQPSDDFEIGITISNLQDVSLHYLVSGWEGFSAIRQRGLHKISVQLPCLHVFPGDYQLNVWIALRGAYYDDAIHEALRFRVEEGRVNEHDTYFARFSKNTQVYVPSKWTCVKLVN